jgi:sugar (pentulose or hexulose) kinase
MNTLGIELGSTRIKAVIIDEHHKPIASGSFDWENTLEDGVWTYSLDAVWAGIQSAVRDFPPLNTVSAIGISAMMHGYLVFDKNDFLHPLVPFRTWRNTSTEQAAKELTTLFGFNIPQRWSVAHLYQAILNGEEHVKDISYITTLAGYVHWKLTGRKVLGIGDASGMFPVENGAYNAKMITKFQKLTGINWLDIAPQILKAGEAAGTYKGIPLCPPEGDAGTGMVATNSISERSGNVSAGTSIFAMLVLEKPLSTVYTEIDIVTTPSRKPVAMVHCNECTVKIDPWVNLFGEAFELFGFEYDKNEVISK